MKIIKTDQTHGVTSRLKSKSRAVFTCSPTLNNCRQPESLLRMKDNDHHLQRGGKRWHLPPLSPPNCVDAGDSTPKREKTI